MARVVALVLAAALLVVAAGTGDRDAQALSCAAPEPGDRARYRERAELIFDGVALSGPRDVLQLVRPARIYVFDYSKGKGPRIVRSASGAPQVFPGDLLGFYTATFEPYMESGSARRFFTHFRSRGPFRVGPPPGPCSPVSAAVDLDRYLVSLGSARRGSRPARWIAQAKRDRDGGLRCLYLRLRPRGREFAAECDRRRRALLAVATVRREKAFESAIAVSGRGLRTAEIVTDDQTVNVPATGRGRVALLTLPGKIDPDEIAVGTRHRVGREQRLGSRPRRALAPDPLDARSWEAVFERGRPRYRGLVCVRWERANGGDSRHGECGDPGRRPFFFAVRRAFDRPEPGLDRRVVFGAIGPGVESVTIEAPSATTPAPLSAQGRSFIVPLLPTDAVNEITVTFHLDDGTEQSFTGRKNLNVARVPPAVR